MKFLCRNCKAKYQIADDKVVGRTLRMTCQQCGEPIVVRSGTATSRSSSQVSRPLAPLTMAGTGPGSLGADFQRQISAPPREVVPHEEWHVAIHDVPVGPMRREEVARKIALNAVDRESLAWREGMDDWLPIKHIPELVGLFPAAPQAAAATITGMPPAPPMPVPPPPAAVPIAPAARVDMAPVGSRQMLSVDEYSVPLNEPTLAIQQLPSETPAAGGGKQLGWGPMFALVSGGAFILAAGAFLGVRVLAPPPAAAPQTVVTSAPNTASKSAEPAANAANDTHANVIELDVQPIDGQQNPAGGRRTGGNTTSGNPPKKELTAEQKEMLARMGGGLDQAGPNLRAPSDTATRSNHGGALTAEQLSAVVLRGRKNLQRCYESALKGSGSSDTVRLDVEIEVSPNGNVTGVKANGKGLPGMDDCITRTVKMWRFPNSGEVTQTRFPVVFQPGA
jgi:hypothetical protein